MKKTGEKKINWARRYMKLLKSFFEEYRDFRIFKGVKIVTAIHLEAKTANFILYLKELGAELTVTACNPLSTQDDVAEALKARGITVYARRTHDVKEYFSNIRKALETAPHLILDDGADLTVMVHTEMTWLLSDLRGISEETTTGVIRLKNMAKEGILQFPVMAVNDALMKHHFDNRYGTGQSAIEGILRATNRLLSGATVVVAGYGWVGRGIARNLQGLKATVIVVEVDPIRALEALYDGFIVTNMLDALQKYKPDFVITATGDRDVVRKEHFEVAPDGLILANAGHFNVEIAVDQLEELAVKKNRVKDCVDEYVLPNGKRLFLLSEGRLVNLARPCGQGHPIEVMDYSFAVQALSLEYLVKNKGKLEPKVYTPPREIDEEIARIKLNSLGIKLEELTEAQKKYLADWKSGT